MHFEFVDDDVGNSGRQLASGGNLARCSVDNFDHITKIDYRKGSLSRTQCDGLYADAENGVRPMTAHFHTDKISRSQTFNSFSTVQNHVAVATCW